MLPSARVAAATRLNLFTEADEQRQGARVRVDAGMDIAATDGYCGTVVDIVVDPARRRLTHLVVQPSGLSSGPRLVPVNAVAEAAEGISLSCSPQDVLDDPIVQETDFIKLDTWPHQHDGWDVGVMSVLAWPHYPSYDPFDFPRWSAGHYRRLRDDL